MLLNACAAEQRAAKPAQAPFVTSAEVEPAPQPVIVPITPSLRVSEDIAAACKLNFNDSATAPKFDFDQDALGPQDTDVLSQVVACVSTGPLAGRSLDLVGRADPRGKAPYNMSLGERRATSVRDFLSSHGVDSGKLSPSSRGELDASGRDEDGWKRDRRVDILLH